MPSQSTKPTAASNTVVTVLGTGTMGAPMARNIAKAGLELRVWNRNRDLAEPLADNGGTVCDSPAEACDGADVVLTVLANQKVVDEVIDRARDGLKDGAVWMQSCTVSPDDSREFAKKAGKFGISFVEAPLLGTKGPAEEGKLTVLAAATQSEARSRVEPIVDAIGQRTVWLDEIGQPSSLKLAYNAWVLTTIEGVAESLTLAKALGVDPALILSVIHGSASDSRSVQSKGSMMINDDLDTPSFPLAAAAKDSVLITDAARGKGFRLGIAETVRQRLKLAVDDGQGHADVAATYRTSRRANGD